jgi:hypothetical protein
MTEGDLTRAIPWHSASTADDKKIVARFLIGARLFSGASRHISLIDAESTEASIGFVAQRPF